MAATGRLEAQRRARRRDGGGGERPWGSPPKQTDGEAITRPSPDPRFPQLPLLPLQLRLVPLSGVLPKAATCRAGAARSRADTPWFGFFLGFPGSWQLGAAVRPGAPRQSLPQPPGGARRAGPRAAGDAGQALGSGPVPVTRAPVPTSAAASACQTRNLLPFLKYLLPSHLGTTQAGLGSPEGPQDPRLPGVLHWAPAGRLTLPRIAPQHPVPPAGHSPP